MKVSRRTYGVFLAVVGIILFMYLLRARTEGFQNTVDNKTVDLVVAKYKENLEWLDKYKDVRFRNVYIYNKSNTPEKECTNEYANCIIKQIPNVGVCDETYLHHIIDNYDNLADVTVFAPGSANLQHKKDIFKFTVDNAITTKDTVMNVYKFDTDIDKAMYNFRMTHYIGASPENNDGNNFNNTPASPNPFGVWFKHNFPGVHTPYSTFFGIFAASKEHIRSRPKSFYEGLIKQVNTDTFHEASHYIERSWFAIMSPVPKSCTYVIPEITNYINSIGAFMNVRRESEGFQESPRPTFHILIATGGRPSLKDLLDSLKGELREEDAITIVFDGPDAEKKSGYSDSWFSGHVCKHTVLTQAPNLGMAGHPVRTKYQTMLTPETTYIMHADDDDEYIKGSFDRLRLVCNDPEVLYIAKMNYDDKSDLITPSQNKKIIQDDIGTPNGIIPFHLAGKAEWGLRYGGDFNYYNALQKDRCRRLQKVSPRIMEEARRALDLEGISDGDTS
jgi:hypothetical protein